MIKSRYLLSEKEIKVLSEIELESYMKWLEKFKKEKLRELTEKKRIIEKINKNKLRNRIERKKEDDEKQIEFIREYLINYK